MRAFLQHILVNKILYECIFNTNAADVVKIESLASVPRIEVNRYQMVRAPARENFDYKDIKLGKAPIFRVQFSFGPSKVGGPGPPSGTPMVEIMS